MTKEEIAVDECTHAYGGVSRLRVCMKDMTRLCSALCTLMMSVLKRSCGLIKTEQWNHQLCSKYNEIIYRFQAYEDYIYDEASELNFNDYNPLF